MYRVLLVDDEPIILSGIKFLVNWEKNDCSIVDTARNGQQALEKIQLHQPDLVICDINMPVMSGIELLRHASEQYPQVVFIMLSNHQEFDLARESLRLRAVDYLLKNQLEPEAIEKSLETAKAEHKQRKRLAQAELVDNVTPLSRQQLLEEAFLRLVQNAPGYPVTDTAALLRANGVTSGFGLIYMPVDLSDTAGETGETMEDRERLFAWQHEVVQKLAYNVFPSHALFAPDRQCESLILVCWDVEPNAWETGLETFGERLSTASSNITQANIGVLATNLFDSVEQLELCRSQLFALRDDYYFNGCARLLYRQMPAMEYHSLGLSGIAGILELELAAKNATGCAGLFDRAIANIKKIPHRRSQAVWLCGELYSAACTVIPRIAPDVQDTHRLFDREQGYQEIDLLFTRNQVVRWLERIRNEILALLEQLSSGRNELAEKARQYALDNVYKRIMLQDVADYVCISPAYLSATFKKMYNQNLVDFINQTKMETACRLIEEGRYRIGEISYMLSFENAYYFSKVFKKHTGMTPTEYQRKQKGFAERV